MSRSARTVALGIVVCFAAGFALAANAQDDSDGIPDELDKCMLDPRNAFAPATCDTDCDGYGNVCDGDFNQNGTVNNVDFSMFFVPSLQTGKPGPRGDDMNCNGTTANVDFGMFFVPQLVRGHPGASGLPCAGQQGCGCP